MKKMGPKLQLVNGTICLVPQKLVPKKQAWFWTKEWQKGELEVDEDIANDRLSEPLKTAGVLLKHLG